MLSPVNMFLLGIVDAKPVNPYEIVSRFEYNRFKNILGIANSTIYAGIRAMHKKGFLEYSLEHNSNLPAKKIYTITECGREELRASVKESLSSSGSKPGEFQMGLMLMHYFSRDEVLGFLRKRRKDFQPGLKMGLDDWRYVRKIHGETPCVSNVASAMLRYLQLKAEDETMSSAIEDLERSGEVLQSTFETDPTYKAGYSEWASENL